MSIGWGECLLRLAVATILGAVIGAEREARDKPAGLRTVTLVSVSAAAFVIAAQQAAARFGEPMDVVRAMAGIAQGVGFLGAGAIVQSRRRVYWLTTAASLWAAAGIGFSVGVGMYMVGAVTALLVFVVLRAFAVIERRFFGPADDES